MPVRVLTDGDRAVGARGIQHAPQVNSSRFGAQSRNPGDRSVPVASVCPASGYLYGTYENPTNAGDGYSMGLPRRRGVVGYRVLPGQSADQGLQRSRRVPMWRTLSGGTRSMRTVSGFVDLRLLVGADEWPKSRAKSISAARNPSISRCPTCPMRH